MSPRTVLAACAIDALARLTVRPSSFPGTSIDLRPPAPIRFPVPRCISERPAVTSSLRAGSGPACARAGTVLPSSSTGAAGVRFHVSSAARSSAVWQAASASAKARSEAGGSLKPDVLFFCTARLLHSTQCPGAGRQALPLERTRIGRIHAERQSAAGLLEHDPAGVDVGDGPAVDDLARLVPAAVGLG